MNMGKEQDRNQREQSIRGLQGEASLGKNNLEKDLRGRNYEATREARQYYPTQGFKKQNGQVMPRNISRHVTYHTSFTVRHARQLERHHLHFQITVQISWRVCATKRNDDGGAGVVAVGVAISSGTTITTTTIVFLVPFCVPILDTTSKPIISKNSRQNLASSPIPRLLPWSPFSTTVAAMVILDPYPFDDLRSERRKDAAVGIVGRGSKCGVSVDAGTDGVVCRERGTV